MVEFEPSQLQMEISSDASVSSSGNHTAPPPKRKRNLPGMPDPEAEVVALSPRTLMATNRFICEICSKGFQRDQNLQLHRRGHNLPWKLRQRVPGVEPRKRVFVCPEEGCVHHDPRRALGDLTGIKKHYCRKHGEKKWKCERCSKKYAVRSDWKAHMKTCGTREYHCDCGTMFSRRDSFITHRAFCDALAHESVRARTLTIVNLEDNQIVVPSSSSSPPPPPLTPSTVVLSPAHSIQSSEVPENPTGIMQPPPIVVANVPTTITSTSSPSSGSNNTANNSIFANMFTSAPPPPEPSPSAFSDMICTLSTPDCVLLEPPMSLSLSSSLYLSTQEQPHHYAPPQTPALSATALLQKAAQMGATGSSSSFLRGLGLDFSLSSSPNQSENNKNSSAMSRNIKPENDSFWLGLGLRSEGGSMMGPTLDFLGLGIGPGGSASTTGFSALLNSISSGFDIAEFGGTNYNQDQPWKDQSESKPPLL